MTIFAYLPLAMDQENMQPHDPDHSANTNMDGVNASIPQGLHVIPKEELDLRSDAEIDRDLLLPRPISDEKNIFFFWHTGYTTMHGYTKRNIRAWHRRFSKRGWVIRVLDRQPGSALNIEHFLNVNDPALFPGAFRNGTVSGDYAAQHMSDLVRWPLLLTYGGVYADVGLIQIGDLDRLWRRTLGNPQSPYEVISYRSEASQGRNLSNYFLASNRNNALFSRCHKLLLALWAADGGKTSTEDMHSSPLLKDLPLMGGEFSIQEIDRTIGPEEVSRMLTDYIIQGQVMTMVMGLVDDEDGWDGPQYVQDHVYGIDFMTGSQLINSYTNWNGQKAFDLMSLALPRLEEGEIESPEQREAREMVEGCLTRSWGFKLAHGFILRVFQNTLGSLWREHDGSDIMPGTYAHWFRYATVHWTQDEDPSPVRFPITPPFKKGPLLREN